MLPELTIIRLFLSHNEWKENHTLLDIKDLPKELHGIYRTLNNFHKEENTDGIDLTCDSLSNLYFASNPRDREYAIGIFDQLRGIELSDETTSRKLLKSLHLGTTLREISLSAYDAAEGRKDVSEVLRLFDRINNVQQSGDTDSAGEDAVFVTDDLDDLINESIKTPGLRWRLNTLNQMLGSLRKGDFGFVFARPETGKTTFLASEVTYMAAQIANEDVGPILWFKYRPLVQ